MSLKEESQRSSFEGGRNENEDMTSDSDDANSAKGEITVNQLRPPDRK